MNTFLKRRALIAAAAAAALPAWSLAQGFPTKPVRIVVPFGAGGIADLTARAIAQALGENLRQSVVVENKPGAGGVVAGDLVAKAEPDGHVLLLMSNGTAVSAGLFQSLPFDAQKDFAPVVTFSRRSKVFLEFDTTRWQGDYLGAGNKSTSNGVSLGITHNF